MLKSALSMDSTFFSLRPGECAEAASVSHKRKTYSYIPVNCLINLKSFSLKHIASVFADKYKQIYGGVPSDPYFFPILLYFFQNV